MRAPRFRSRAALLLLALAAVVALLALRDGDDGAAPARTASAAPLHAAIGGVAARTLPPTLRPRGGWQVNASPPIDPAQGALAFGERSHWLQPWRSYLDTWPATRLRDAIGINFNVAGGFDAAARRLAAAGVRRARIELPWRLMSYERPGTLIERERVRAALQLRALRQHGIRPLVLLNSHEGAPCPSLPFLARVVRPARRGDRTLLVDAATAVRVAPGRSGLDHDELAAGVLFAGVADGGVVRLAKPLPADVPAGDYSAHVLRFAPFGPPKRSDGSRDPGFEATLDGWLAYVGGMTAFVRATLGDTRFDVEVWNELSFGSAFLDAGRYRDDVSQDTGAVTAELLARTVALLRDPARHLDGVAIADGFASQRPWDAASTTPRGLTALAKHPYRGATSFPAQARFDRDIALDALGRPDADVHSLPEGGHVARDRFVPRYRAFLPELFLTGLTTETLIRDLSPRTSEIYGTPHGRHAKGPGGDPLEVWVTEIGMDPSGLDPSRPSPPGRGRARLSRDAVARLQAKAALRAYIAYVGKGARAVYLYAAEGPVFGIAGNRVAMRALTRLTRRLATARPLARRRPLRLEQVADDGRGRQFRGDGTAAHPPLRDRDVLAFLPFQLDAHAWIAPVYVMTRDLARRQRPAPFLLRIGGLDGRRAHVRLDDPLSGRPAPVAVLRRERHAITVALQASDSPRLLELRER